MAVTRRTFVGSAAGAAAAAAVASAPARAARTATTRARSADVIVVGAGLSGLAAARTLARRGRSVIVLEARDRVGGRTWTIERRGSFIDVGGQFVGPTQTAILALAKSLGVKRFKPYAEGEGLFENQGEVSRFTDLPPLPVEDLVAYSAASAQLNEMAKSVSTRTPWTTPEAQAWDWQTMQSWLDANVPNAGARELLTFQTESPTTLSVGEMSLLTVLLGLAGGPESEEPETWRFVGGAQQLSEGVARGLGDRVVLGAPVSAIDRSSGGVTVASAAGRFRGEHVIVAIAPALASRIRYDPPLPALRDGLTQRFANGSVLKCQAIYPKPFWRTAGLSGKSVNLSLPVAATFDNCPPSGSPGILLGFVVAQHARALFGRSARARRQVVLDTFVKLFGPQAARPMDYVEGNWSADPWTRGCFSGIATPGAWVGFGPAWRRPVGNIHWAATESATRWNSYMDGAVRAGEAAAGEVLSGHTAAAAPQIA